MFEEEIPPKKPTFSGSRFSNFWIQCISFAYIKVNFTSLVFEMSVG